MYNCIRMEFRKCFHSHNFIISMATCVLLALSSASYCCQGYLNIHDALDQYCFETDIWSLTSCSLSGLPIIIGLAVSRKRLLTLPSTRCFRYLQFFPTRYLVSRRKIILCQPDDCACRPSALLSFQRDRMFFRSVYHDCYSTHLKFCCHGCFYSKHGRSNQLRNL